MPFIDAIVVTVIICLTLLYRRNVELTSWTEKAILLKVNESIGLNKVKRNTVVSEAKPSEPNGVPVGPT
jgi:hypothetical protein